MNEQTTLAIYRPFGDATPTTEDIACRYSNAFTVPNRNCPLIYTHAVEVADDVDIRDGAEISGADASSLTLNTATADEVRITGGSLDPATRFVVVWVDHIITPPGHPAKKIAYLLRHSAAWPGP